jgi:hypothetical protein
MRQDNLLCLRRRKFAVTTAPITTGHVWLFDRWCRHLSVQRAYQKVGPTRITFAKALCHSRLSCELATTNLFDFECTVTGSDMLLISTT